MNKNVLITGANRGTGLAIARAFYEAGHHVIAFNRTKLGEHWLEEIPCDISNPQELLEACRTVTCRVEAIHVCIMNAAIRHFARIEHMTDQQWKESFDTNINANFQIARFFIPSLRETKGSFVFIGSNSSTHFFEEGSAYCVTKAALKVFAEVLMLETQPMGVRTLLLTAGAIKNRPKEYDETKILPESIGKIIVSLVNAPPDVFVGEVDIRPALARQSPITGIDRLQYFTQG